MFEGSLVEQQQSNVFRSLLKPDQKTPDVFLTWWRLVFFIDRKWLPEVKSSLSSKRSCLSLLRRRLFVRNGLTVSATKELQSRLSLKVVGSVFSSAETLSLLMLIFFSIVEPEKAWICWAQALTGHFKYLCPELKIEPSYNAQIFA